MLYVECYDVIRSQRNSNSLEKLGTDSDWKFVCKWEDENYYAMLNSVKWLMKLNVNKLLLGSWWN